MDLLLTRRRLVSAALFAPLLALPGCATTGYGRFSTAEAVRRLLLMSTDRAFARLAQSQGFFADDLTRIPLPPELSTGARVSATFLRMPFVQQQILQVVNRAAFQAADRAMPYLIDEIRRMPLSDTLDVVRGGPEGATNLLARAVGPHLVDILFPDIANTLRLVDSGPLADLTRQATGIDFGALHRFVATTTAQSIYRAIGREEALIRSDPRATGDPLIVRLLAGGV